MVAVSGGPDSVALLEVLVELRERLGVELCVAHLNHRLRGREGDEDAAFVAERAAALGLAVRVVEADVAGERARSGGSVEMAARRARYAFLERVAAELGARKVAVGHTADDQVETVLQRLLRGGELAALCGMPVSRPLSPTSGATVIRPLLGVTRAEVVEYLARRGVGWRADASNADRAFQRNWVRHELLPFLEARCGPGVRAQLLALAGPARELFAVVERQAECLVAHVPRFRAKARNTALTPSPAEMLLGLPGVSGGTRHVERVPRLVFRAAVRRAWAALGKPGELHWRTIDALEDLADGEAGRAAALPHGVVAERTDEGLVFRSRREPPAAVSRELPVPGRVEVPEAGLWVEAEVLAGAPSFAPGDRWREVVDLDAVGEHLEVRTRRPGDRLRPLGLGGTKKLKDLLIDERVPRGERERTLLVEGRGGIAWVVGLRLDEGAKVTPQTRRFVRLTAGPLGPGRDAKTT